MQQFPIQNYISEHGTAIGEMAAKYEIENSIARLREQSSSFIIPVPLIGDFSCGKSSLLNAIVGEKLLSIDINPTTAIPAELYAAASESYAIHRPGAAPQPIEKTQFKDLQKSIEKEAADAPTSPAPQADQAQQPQETTYLSIGHPAANLQRWPHLRLVDLPGLGAGNARHKLAIDGYASRSLAYVLVVPCDEGTLKQSVQDALRELGVQDMPVICVISKCDKRPPEDIDEITREIKMQAEKALGRPPLLTVRAARGDVHAVIGALEQLEQQAESICGCTLGLPLADVLRDVQARQIMMRDKAKYSAEELKKDKEEAEREAAAFQQRIAERSQTLQEDLPRIHERILHGMDAALAAHTDEWIDALLNQRAAQVQTQMENTARLALQESFGAESDFARALYGYLEGLAADMPASFDPGRFVERIAIDSIALPEGSNKHALEGATTGAALGSALAPIITKLLSEETVKKTLVIAISRVLPPAVAGPIGWVIAGLFTVGGFLLGSKQDEVERARQREAARDQARSALNDARQQVISAVAPKLLDAMHAQIGQVQNAVQQDAEARLAQYTQTLSLIEQNLNQSEAEQQQRAADLEQTSVWLNTVTAFPGAAA